MFFPLLPFLFDNVKALEKQTKNEALEEPKKLPTPKIERVHGVRLGLQVKATGVKGASFCRPCSLNSAEL